MVQKKFNKYWNKKSWINSHKTENVKLNISSTIFLIWSLTETNLLLSQSPLAKPTSLAKQS